ncbi:MAG: hypothetical protein EA353_03615 [Puniceicoccaceae bacterium]|nr:MAG: hypothetical protein EA353_03615 [Puniceicoccaceae bacterium]
MSDLKKASAGKVSVEDLLRIKRAERPDTAFWNTFDRELHQRMLQTLVKKDPWYVQVMRGLTGRIGQAAAAAGVAVLIAMLVLRPAMLESDQSGSVYLAEDASTIVETLQSQVVSAALKSFGATAVADYRTDTISGKSAGKNYTAEYALDSFEVASYDRDVYRSDSVSFALSGVATGLVY